VVSFDRLIDEAWPAPGRTEAAGWVYRYAAGVTKRANSVLPLGPRADLAAAVDEAERFYASLGLPVVFSMGAEAAEGLDAELAARGYRVVDPTLIMTRPLSDEDASVEPGGVEPAPTREWFDVWWRVDGRTGPDPGTARWNAARILTGVPALYASSPVPQRVPAAVGRGVIQREWLGIYCMAVLPEARRRGHARDVLRALLSAGRRQGAKRAYLAVTEANTAARALYESAGFTVSGRYHYRIR